ncbi:ATPase [Microbacterium sp. EYE_5]|uniref:FGGY-family carbohydrate kinase n=1 Tax=unclassified Microbacterium TaxID=2609290 RepID=UPI00200336C5|nr:MULTISPECIES: FGGY-family carbohydrate kinase [unclassified Microbacterium]MCK6079258.1 ATPase [Microbacterium sp. EYE_382]MCK6084528.1 ATPase [Microbacterium sp. EYE_384]MCK6123243.1 ATPase [Microbacterium sp. EYE_80]MCK6125292.1 ATPase [Microbacterium sp. EYE_79]MCK6140212.1 ATPase [Microbacterium sp. EYE_39]
MSAIAAGRAVLGIELGSTRIKACLVDASDPTVVLAVGSHEWENALEGGVWTYAEDAIWSGLQAAYADLVADVRRQGAELTDLAGIGVSAMMHGYLAFDADGTLLVPFRTWRNTSTGAAAAELTDLLGVNIPLRWSIAHLHQAVLDDEAHLASLAKITTLAGWVHEKLTGRFALGVGDASGMFPIGPDGGYDRDRIAAYDAHAADFLAGRSLTDLLPEVLPAGADAGALTAAGAALLDPTGILRPGAVAAPAEGDAGTGMVATNAVSPRTGNVSAGTSIFAMVVLERPLERVHTEIDLVTTPAGDPVAMVHCNNGASELAAWAALFARFAAASGQSLSSDAVYETLLREALEGGSDAGGLLAYNHLSGEPIAGLAEGRPLLVRTPDADFSLANLMRAQVYGVFATLAIGMQTLAEEGVELDAMFAHGGVFRTAGVAQRFLAGALDVPVTVGDTAAEGGAWGMAVLAAYAVARTRGTQDAAGSAPERPDASPDLAAWLTDRVFAGSASDTATPEPADVAGFADYLARYRDGLAVEAAAVTALPLGGIRSSKNEGTA